MVSLTTMKQRLRRKKIKIDRLKPSTIKRLYRFYIVKNNPASSPRDLAYGKKKAFYDKLSRERKIMTGTGRKIQAKTYVKKYTRKTRKNLVKVVSRNVTKIFLDKYYPTVKHVKDMFTYGFYPPIHVNYMNRNQALKRIAREIEDIIRELNKLWEERRFFYKEALVGAIIFAKSEGTPDSLNPRGVRSVPYTTPSSFRNVLSDTFRGLIGDVLNNYPNASLRINRIDVYITTSVETPQNRLRVLSRYGRI